MPKSFIKLISAEGFEFTVDYKAACVSNTVKQMLSSEGTLDLNWPQVLCSMAGLDTLLMSKV